MNQKSEVILLQIVKALEKNEWSTGKDWQLTFKTDGHIPLIRSIVANASMDGDKWKDQIEVYITLKVATEDEWTYFPEFTLYAQIAIGSISPQDIAYKMIGNEAFMEKDIKDAKKFISAAREIDRMVQNHIGEVYQDYVDKNDDLVRFYKQGLSEHGMPKVQRGAWQMVGMWYNARSKLENVLLTWAKYFAISVDTQICMG